LSLAEIHASLERAADVLTTVKGLPARGRQRHRATGPLSVSGTSPEQTAIQQQQQIQSDGDKKE
jgi:hypothetical protein